MRGCGAGLLAEPLSAREAYDAGLVTHVASDEDFPAVVEKIVRRLAAGPPLALAAMGDPNVARWAGAVTAQHADVEIDTPPELLEHPDGGGATVATLRTAPPPPTRRCGPLLYDVK